MNQHPLYKPVNRRRLWWLAAGIVAATLLVQLLLPLHGYFGFDGWFGFHAGYGFVTCVIMVMLARLAGRLVRRHEDYYGDD